MPRVVHKKVEHRIDAGNGDYQPHGGNVKIFNENPEFRQAARPRVDAYREDQTPHGGDVRIYSEKVQFRETAKPRTDCGGQEYRPHGGNVAVFDAPVPDWRNQAKARTVNRNQGYQGPSGGNVRTFEEKPKFRERAKPRIDAGDPVGRTARPSGGNVRIFNQKPDWSRVKSRVDANNEGYAPRGGNVKIFDEMVVYD